MRFVRRPHSLSSPLMREGMTRRRCTLDSLPVQRHFLPVAVLVERDAGKIANDAALVMRGFVSRIIENFHSHIITIDRLLLHSLLPFIFSTFFVSSPFLARMNISPHIASEEREVTSCYSEGVPVSERACFC